MIVVATAPQTIEVPDVTGLSESDAISVLLDAGLEAGQRTRRYSDVFAEGDVMRTDPRAGTRVVPGSVVDYTVSRGPAPEGSPTPQPTATATPKPTPKPVVVPGVRSQPEDVAISILIDAKLKIGNIIPVPNNQVPAGLATKTEPKAGTTVPRGSTVDLYISTGPAAPIETPRPTAKPTPRPTTAPTPAPTMPGTEDRLARILRAGVDRVNLASEDGPWSFEGPEGGRGGFDAVVARQLAKQLGVTLEVSTVPVEEVRAGIWDDRFDIAISRLAVLAADPALLEYSTPYAFDPQQLAVTQESGFTTPEELAGGGVCVDVTDTGAAWLNGMLALAGAPLEPASPPAGAVAFPGPTNADCEALIAATGAPFVGWLASLPTVNQGIADGLPVSVVGIPSFWAPVGVAFDARAGDNASLIVAVDDALARLDAAGTLAKASLRSLGYDLTVVPPDGVPTPVVPVPEPFPAG